MKLEEEGFDAWSRTRLIHMLESACGLGHTEETDTLWCQLRNGRLVPVVWSCGREVISQIKTTKFPGRNCTVSTCLYKVRGNFIIQQVLELSHHSNWLVSVSYSDSAAQVVELQWLILDTMSHRLWSLCWPKLLVRLCSWSSSSSSSTSSSWISPAPVLQGCTAWAYFTWSCHHG